MPFKQYVAVAAAFLGGFAGNCAAGVGDQVLGPPLMLAQAAEVRQEDRRADRQQDAAAQLNLTLPRTGDGIVDTAALLDALEASFAAGAREIQIRDGSLTQAESRELFLALTPDQNLLRRIGDAFPAGPGEFQVRFRDTVDARVQRQPDGSLRVRMENIDLSGLSAAERADLAQQLSQQTGFDRVRLQGVDADGSRVRVEFRADHGLVVNREQTAGGSGSGRNDGPRPETIGDRGEGRGSVREIERGGGGSGRSGRADMQRTERPEVSRPERVEFQRPERVEIQRPERPERSGSSSGRH